jgi:hypothetical protein
MWVWQFSSDGEPSLIGKRLKENGLGILLKTHDGVTWMSDYDKSPYSVSRPDQVRVLANYFEAAALTLSGPATRSEPSPPRMTSAWKTSWKRTASMTPTTSTSGRN